MSLFVDLIKQIHVNWRYTFYFLLGFVPSIFFGLRILIQWISSEKKKKSTVGPLFWKLSILGNLFLALHYFIQFQYQFLFIQVINAFISWRNLDYLQTKKPPSKLSLALLFLLTALGTAVLICFLQNQLSSYHAPIFEVPIGLLSNQNGEVSILWHLFGIFGAVLFASRFWVQWLKLERSKHSELDKNFWQLSILGSLFALVYFFKIQDLVSIANYLFGLIPYFRNILLMHHEKKKSHGIV